MTKIDIFSGFLGAGKTTLIKKLINEAYKGEKIVLIENEFGEIGIDGGFLKEAGIEINEMNSGCICCSLVGDFTQALNKVLDEFSPDRILIEPSGVGKLSDVIKAVREIKRDDVVLSSFTAVADAKKCKIYMKNFGEFYNDQIENASCIVLSHTKGMDKDKLEACIKLIREKNADATLVTTDWDLLDGKTILDAMEGSRSFKDELDHFEQQDACPHCGHHHEHHHDEECECGHHHEHHHHDDECDGGHHHEHHHHDEECECGHHHEHHHHDEECECGHHHHHEHGHHHADDVFTSWGIETTAEYTEDKIRDILKSLDVEEKFGIILRAKGIVAGNDGKWIHFDYIPGEADVRLGGADIIGRICVIGSNINTESISELFN